MDKKLSQIFKNIKELELPKNLESLILQKIEIKNRRKMRMELIFSHIGIFGSVLAIIYVGFIFGGSFLKSEFWSISSLAFSDAMVVVSNWKDFLYSLLETFPFMHVVAMLIPIFTMLWSLSFYADLYGKNNNKYHVV